MALGTSQAVLHPPAGEPSAKQPDKCLSTPDTGEKASMQQKSAKHIITKLSLIPLTAQPCTRCSGRGRHQTASGGGVSGGWGAGGRGGVRVRAGGGACVAACMSNIW